MNNGKTESCRRVAYPVWDRTTRLFHWINALCVIVLAALGLAILNEKMFGVSADGKVLLKTFHVYTGYVFSINIAWRLIWGFVGGPYARWRSLLPVGQGYGVALLSYVRGFASGHPPTYLGHNPLGRLVVSLLLLLVIVQSATGLVLAGTDLYKPPFGDAIAEWVTAGDAEKLINLKPGSNEFVDPAAYEEMRAFRKPVVSTHLYVFYILMITVLLHVMGVIVTEIREKSGLLSAMITGQKVLSSQPVDARPEHSSERRES